MTTYNTGNALGSSDPRDLYDNAENLDNFANGAANTYPDRLGVTRKSLAGMRSAFDDFLQSSGYTVPVPYAAGIALTAYNQLIEYNDEFYRLKAGEAPYTTTGTWGTDSAKLVAVGDAALRQELTANANDFHLLPGIANYAALRAYAGPVTAYYVRGVANIFDGGAGVFRVDAADTTTADNGGTVLVDTSGRRWKREFSGAANVLWFGAKTVEQLPGFDSTSAIQSAINANSNVSIPPGTFLCNGQLALRANLSVSGSGIGITRIKKAATAFGGAMCANSNSDTEQIANITLRDFTLFDDVFGLGFAEHQHLLTFHGVDNVLVDRVEFYGFRGDGIYIGEWDGTIRTRLNTNINVTNCMFDGINKENRNGISVVTGRSISIANNVFQNVTRPNMPGAIDLEPDASVTSVIEDVIITGNRFYNVGGNVGAVAAVIPANTAKFQNITVTGNTFKSCLTAFAVLHQRVTSEHQNIVFAGNSAAGVGRLFQFSGATNRGITVTGNTVSGSNTSLLGFGSADIVENAVVANNTFVDGTSSSTGALGISGQAKSIVVSGNTFNNWFDYAIKIGTDAGDSFSDLSVANNVAFGLRGAQDMVRYAAGTLDGASCGYSNNIGGGNTSRFWKTDDCGGVTNDTTALSFNSATLPDSFRSGTSMAVINGDTGVPSTGGFQGTIVTVRPTLTGGFSKWVYQIYYPANNGVDVGSLFMRKRQTASNAWTSWYKVTGV